LIRGGDGRDGSRIFGSRNGRGITAAIGRDLGSEQIVGSERDVGKLQVLDVAQRVAAFCAGDHDRRAHTLDRVLVVALQKDCSVVAGAAIEGVGAASAGKDIIERITDQRVVPVATDRIFDLRSGRDSHAPTIDSAGGTGIKIDVRR